MANVSKLPFLGKPILSILKTRTVHTVVMKFYCLSKSSLFVLKFKYWINTTTGGAVYTWAVNT